MLDSFESSPLSSSNYDNVRSDFDDYYIERQNDLRTLETSYTDAWQTIVKAKTTSELLASIDLATTISKVQSILEEKLSIKIKQYNKLLFNFLEKTMLEKPEDELKELQKRYVNVHNTMTALVKSQLGTTNPEYKNAEQLKYKLLVQIKSLTAKNNQRNSRNVLHLNKIRLAADKAQIPLFKYIEIRINDLLKPPISHEIQHELDLLNDYNYRINNLLIQK